MNHIDKIYRSNLVEHFQSYGTYEIELSVNICCESSREL